jgi:hypothetical protein
MRAGYGIGTSDGSHRTDSVDPGKGVELTQLIIGHRQRKVVYDNVFSLFAIASLELIE